MDQYIIITGNPVQGFSFIGPFANQVDATKHGNEDGHLDTGDWWIAPLEAP